ncbi:MAG: MerR family transcriptional regulator, partial [Candidatus Dormibacteraceae bacterium]
MEYRVEQLARAAGVAVDTLRFYLGQGLLQPPRRDGRITWYGEAHLERLRQIRDLQQRGFSLGVTRRFLEGSLEATDRALVEAITTSSESASLTRAELAVESGLDESLLTNLETAGLLIPLSAEGETRYSREDQRALVAGLALIEAGLPLTALLELGSEHTVAIENTARRAVG